MAQAQTSDIEKRILQFSRGEVLIQRGGAVLVAVSGGADSTALLLLLSRLAPKLGIEVRAAHFNHRLRGKRASEREREAVESLAGDLRVSLTTGEGDVRSFAHENRIGIEEAAREMRYAFLARAAQDEGARVVAVGHTADDQVETVLLHILRGSGVSGLAGMLPKSPWPVHVEGGRELTLVRPLLRVRRSETEAYCSAAGRRPLEDASNRSLRFRRNVIRYQLLPLLRERAPQIDEALLRLAGTAALERQALEASAARALAEALELESEGVLHLSRPALEELPPALLPHVWRTAISRLLGDARDVGERHLSAMTSALRKPAGKQLDLPRGLRLSVGYGEIALALRKTEKIHEPLPVEPSPIAVSGMTNVAGWRIEVTIGESSTAGATATDASEALMDADAVAGELSVRRRRSGDRFRPLGLEGEKKLQDIFVDAKVPRQERDGVPIVCDERGIVWVWGYRIAERVKVFASTRRVVRLVVTPTAAGGHAGGDIEPDEESA